MRPLVELELWMHHQTEKAVLVSIPGKDKVWLPKSRIEFEERGLNPKARNRRDPETIVQVTLPEALAVEKGLV
jgi:hypothetical protein